MPANVSSLPSSLTGLAEALAAIKAAEALAAEAAQNIAESRISAEAKASAMYQNVVRLQAEETSSALAEAFRAVAQVRAWAVQAQAEAKVLAAADGEAAEVAKHAAEQAVQAFVAAKKAAEAAVAEAERALVKAAAEADTAARRLAPWASSRWDKALQGLAAAIEAAIRPYKGGWEAWAAAQAKAAKKAKAKAKAKAVKGTAKAKAKAKKAKASEGLPKSLAAFVAAAESRGLRVAAGRRGRFWTVRVEAPKARQHRAFQVHKRDLKAWAEAAAEALAAMPAEAAQGDALAAIPAA